MWYFRLFESMRCIVSSCCNDDSTCISQGITFHSFPTDPLQCIAWLRALNKEDYKPDEMSVICSNHFIKNDLYIDWNGQCQVRVEAVPIVNLVNFSNNDCWRACDVKVCRICFANGCNLYEMTTCNKLDEAYESLTGLLMENDSDLPSYLCVECAHRLLNCINFKNKSLRSHSVLLETIKNHGQITLESLQTASGYSSKSNLCVKHIPIDHYDLIIEHKGSDDDNTEIIQNNKQMNITDTINNESNITYRIKSEDFDTYNQNIKDTVATNHNTEYLIDTSLDIVRIKTENEMIEKSSINDAAVEEDMCSDEVGREYPWENSTQLKSPGSEQEIKPSSRTDENGLLDANQLSCNLCSYQTTEELLILNHLKTHSKTKLLMCVICNFKTKDKRVLKEHKKVHSLQRNFSCHICKKTINSLNNYWRHLRTHKDEKPYSCDICGKGFKRPDHCKGHMIVHSKEKAYSCDICNQAFKRKDHYKTHLKQHTERKSVYTCDVCKKFFSRKSNLQTHMNLHTGEKPYSCKVCNKKFRRTNNLKKHYMLHDKKPFLCDICSKCFSRKSKLRTHIQQHSTRSPCTCNVCKKVYISKASLLKHLRKYCLAVNAAT